MIIILQASSSSSFSSSQYYYRYPQYSNENKDEYNYECLLNVSPGEYVLSVEFFGQQLININHLMIENSPFDHKSMIL